MQPDILIEQATLSDLDAILDIEHFCFPFDCFSRKQFAYLITKSKGIFYVLKQQEKVVAYVTVVTNVHTRNARIYSIAVHPEARGNNYGQILLEKSIEFARQKQMKAINLEVNTNNTPAINLYEKNGFTTILIRKDYYLDGSDAFGMRLFL